MSHNICLFTPKMLKMALEKDIIKKFNFLAEESVKRGISLPEDIQSVGELVLFLEWEVTSPIDFMSWVNKTVPSDETKKVHFHFTCSFLADLLEEWKNKPSEYLWIAMMVRGDFDD